MVNNMYVTRWYYCIFVVLLLASCGKKNKLPINIVLTDLEEEGFFEQATSVEIPFDYMFKSPKRYEAVTLEKIISSKISLNDLDLADLRLIFICDDNYIVSMTLQKALSKTAYVAIRDLDAPKGQDWSVLQSDDKKTIIAPYYMVWKDAPLDDHSYVWPYQLNTIQIVKL